MSEGIQWCIALTACAIALIVTLAIVIPPAGHEPSCVGHGGVVSSRLDSGIHTTYFICRDGMVIER